MVDKELSNGQHAGNWRSRWVALFVAACAGGSSIYLYGQARLLPEQSSVDLPALAIMVSLTVVALAALLGTPPDNALRNRRLSGSSTVELVKLWLASFIALTVCFVIADYLKRVEVRSNRKDVSAALQISGDVLVIDSLGKKHRLTVIECEFDAMPLGKEQQKEIFPCPMSKAKR